MKAEIEAATKKYMNEKCDSKGKSGEFLVQLTDKSGQLCVDTKDNYVASMQPHIENDLVISLEERDKTERILNGHCIQLTRILKMGQDHGHETQVRSAVTNHSCHMPVIYRVKKTNKPLVPGQPVPVRPIVGADEANNQQISQILADIVVTVTKIMDLRMAGAICRSSEEMMAAMTEVNELQDTKNLVILSTDISTMFPSMDIAECAKIAADMFYE